MKKLAAIVMATLLVMSVTVALAGGVADKATQSENIIEYTKIVEIAAPEPVIGTYWGYHVPMIHSYNFMAEPSVPMLPVKSFSLVIPQTAEIKSIKVTSSTKEELRGDYDIMPVQEPVPISRNTPVAFTEKNPSIYASTNPYPGKLIEYAGEGNLRDYRILSINVYPLQYNPAGKKLTFYSNIEIEVIYTAPPAKTEKTEEDEFARMVKKMVENPEDIGTLSATATEATVSELPAQENKYIIITSEDLENEFQTLADHKIGKGLSAEVVNLSWITNNYNGADAQEQIRNFIIDAEDTWGTTWVLLGGDTDVIPHRLAYSDYNSEYIPADLYYSDLDGDWDADGDLIYGELTDNVDMYPDVFVGRAPVNSVVEAQTFVSKTIAYEEGPSGYETTALFMAEYLDRKTDGAVTKDIIDDESIPEHFTVTKLYESLGNLNHENAINGLNQGYGLINHIGHANYNVLGIGQDALYNSDMDSLTNTQSSIFYSIGCWSNALDRDSIAEHFVLNPDGGGIAYIGNSRYGWYLPRNPGYGSSDMYDREFFSSLFNEGLDNIGETLGDSKAAHVPTAQSANTYRYIQYALNLLGDPETQIWITTVQDTTPPVITEVYSTVTSITATITWTTDESANSTVNYGTTTALGTTESDGSMTTSHSITLIGLSPGTTYYYEVKSTDASGNTATADNTGDYYTFTTTEQSENSMHVSDITMGLSTRSAGRNIFYKATATVTIVDADGYPVAGATVSGRWSGLTSDPDSGTTGVDGKIALDSDSVKNVVGTFTFTVDDVTKDGWDYYPAANVETIDSISVP